MISDYGATDEQQENPLSNGESPKRSGPESELENTQIKEDETSRDHNQALVSEPSGSKTGIWCCFQWCCCWSIDEDETSKNEMNNPLSEKSTLNQRRRSQTP